MQQISRALMAAGAMAVFATGPAMAQKSEDTIRVALHQPMGVIDGFYDPRPEQSLVSFMVFDSLVMFDAEQRKFVPHVAESWTRIDGKTMEFKIRQGIKFHDGSDLDADDVVHSLNFGKDPKYAFRFKGTRFGYIDKVEKIDQYTVRITAKRDYFAFLGRLASQPPIYPSDYHTSFKDPTEFGKKPIGSGNFRVVSVDATKGVVLEKFDGYKHSSSAKPAAQAKRIHLTQVPDRQTQIAKMITGELDIIYNVALEQADELRKMPNLAVEVEPTVTFSYIYFDAVDKSGIGVFKDIRVREALMQAIDRNALKKALLPQEMHNEPLQDAMCHSWHISCASSAKVPTYDLDKAKALLKEAGLQDGFKLEITTWGASIKTAEAVAGMLRRVGVEATVDAQTFVGYLKKRSANKVNTFVSLWDNGGAQPDVENTAGFFWLKGSRDYHGDEILHGLVGKGGSELDPEKRAEIFASGFDRIIEQRYQMPLIPIPSVVVHDKGVEIQGGHKSPKGFELNRIRWK